MDTVLPQNAEKSSLNCRTPGFSNYPDFKDLDTAQPE
jgi:hypothetical protein